MTPTLLEPYSAKYLLAPEIEVNTHPGDLAIMDEDVYVELVKRIGEPIVGQTGGLHYEFAPSREVLADRAAVPRRNHDGVDKRMALLLAK